MSDPTPEVATKVSTDAAKKFIDSFYPALNDPALRATLSSFYISPTSTLPVGPDISLNGNLFSSGQDLQVEFQKMPKAHYEVQSYDCHVVNTNYNVGVPDNLLGPDSGGKKISLIVTVSGYVKYGDDLRDAAMRGFSETFLLVPNYEKLGRNYLIQSQNYRMVV